MPYKRTASGSGGGGGQPLDSDLTDIAGLTATSDNFLQAKSSAWASRTVAQVKTDLGITGITADSTSLMYAPGGGSQIFKMHASSVSGLPGTVGRDDFGNWTSVNYSPYSFFRDARVNVSSSHDAYQAVVWTSGTKNVSTRAHGFDASMQDDTSVKNTAVTGATNASPIAITATAHGWTTGTRIVVDSVGGNTAANGSWLITVVNANTFTLDGSTGNGAYTSGGVVTNRPMYYAFNATVSPRVDRGGLTGVNAFADDANCYVAYNGGTARGTDAFYLGHNSANFTGSAHEWITAYTCDASVQFGVFNFSGRLTGGASADAAVFHAHGAIIDSGGYLLTAPNDGMFSARNAAGSGFIDMFKVNSSDALSLAPGGAAVALGGTLTVADAKNIAVGTGTGTKIGTNTTQKIGFWNTAPVVQQGNVTLSNYTSGSRSFDRSSYTVDQLADLVSEIYTGLKTTGILA